MIEPRIVAVVCVMAGALGMAAPVHAQDTSDARVARGQALTHALFEGDATLLYPQFAPAFQQAIGGEAGATRFAEAVRSQLGAETRVTLEEAIEVDGVVFYTRIAEFAGLPQGTATISWTWRGDTILGGSVRPTPQPAPSEYLDYETHTPLRLPFADEFTVFWGGRLPHQNYHVVHADQRFAYDLVIARDGSTHTGDGTRNEDYYCFGRPILAPAAGTITMAVDTLPDQTPGQMMPAAPAGNHVVIDHGNDEYSLLAHLRSGSVSVAVGNEVDGGQQIGECGNSGNTSEPHLHYHLQDRAAFGPPAQGLPSFFVDYVADGVKVERGEPVRGQRIRPGSE